MIKMTKGFILTDIAGADLTAEDRDLIQHPALFGILLFARNYESPQQLSALTADIHRLNPNIIIVTDQEGGRVQRFVEGFTTLKPMSYWGELYDQDSVAALTGLHRQTMIMATELQHCGVQMSLAPVLDINYQISEIIGERSFHQEPQVISRLARCVIDAMHCCKMPTIGKHFPGHGAVAVDSHLGLPVDERSWQQIWQQDMLPYCTLITELDAIMPAHIIYPAVDETMPAGFSRRWITEILRNQLNYQGVIITDDLTMAGAASVGDYSERVGFALEAGCDILTICNNRQGLIQVLDNYSNYYNPLSNEKVRNYISFLT